MLESLPLDNWSYKAIEYLHLKGNFKNLYYNTKPWKKNEVVEALKEYEHYLKERKIVVSKYDEYLFNRLKQEFDHSQAIHPTGKLIHLFSLKEIWKSHQVFKNSSR